VNRETLKEDLAEDVKGRSKTQPTEHPLISRLVVLRVALNHEFGGAFTPYDHELAEIEGELVKLIGLG
jgi:hypothetical protein